MHRNARITDNLGQMYKEKGEWQSMMVKLKAAHVNAVKSAKHTESKMAESHQANKMLVEKNTSLNVALQRTTKQYQDLLGQMKDVETKCNLEKSNAFEECYRMISDNKKKQWCVVCEKQGGRYYCSSQCEEYFWFV